MIITNYSEFIGLIFSYFAAVLIGVLLFYFSYKTVVGGVKK